MDSTELEQSQRIGGDFGVFIDIVKGHMAFLERLSYTGPVVSFPGENDAGGIIKAVYASSFANREVSISVQQEAGSSRVYVAIWRLPVVTFRKDLINLEVFAWKNIPGFDLQSLDLTSYSGSISDRLESLMKTITAVLQGPANELLAGQWWEEGLYDY